MKFPQDFVVYQNLLLKSVHFAELNIGGGAFFTHTQCSAMLLWRRPEGCALLLSVPRVHTEFARRAFSVSRNAEPTVYNSLPADIRLWYSVDSFIFSERSRLYAAKRLCIQECYRRYIKCCSKLYVACKKSSTKWPITLNLTRSLEKTRATAHKT